MPFEQSLLALRLDEESLWLTLCVTIIGAIALAQK
jgi:hypothetical protein